MWRETLKIEYGRYWYEPVKLEGPNQEFLIRKEGQINSAYSTEQQ